MKKPEGEGDSPSLSVRRVKTTEGIFLASMGKQIVHLREVRNRRDSIFPGLVTILAQRDKTIEGLLNALHRKNREVENLQESLLQKDLRISELENRLEGMEAVIEDLRVVPGKEDALKDARIPDLERKVYEGEAERETIKRALAKREGELNRIYDSHGWRALTAYYALRDRVFPIDSGRRSVAKKVFRLLLSLLNPSTKEEPRPAAKATEGKLACHVDTDLSKPLVVGAGNALYLKGSCFHTTRRIKRLSALVDGTDHPISNFSILRQDVDDKLQETGQKGNSAHSGFWTIIPFDRIDSPRQVDLKLRAVLSGKETCEFPIGILHLEPGIQSEAKPGAKKENRGQDQPGIDGHSLQDPLIAICMATFNPSIGHFRQQIDSILQQSYTNWVCIINDDCSNSEIYEEIRRIVSNDERFVLSRNASNVGFYYNFERCLSKVPEQASYIALADQDDYWHVDKLSTLLNHFDPDTQLVYSDMNIVNEKGEKIESTFWTMRKNNFADLSLLLITNTVTGAACMFRKKLVDALLPFPQKIGESYHDNFIACAALSLGKIKYVDSPLYDYRQHANNICGHRIPSHRESGRAKINSQPFHSLLKNFQSTLLYYRSQYYGDFIRRILIAQVISLRCQGLSGKKKKIVERFASLEKKWYAILLETVGNRILQKGAIAFGNDSRLLKSALSIKLLSLL